VKNVFRNKWLGNLVYNDVKYKKLFVFAFVFATTLQLLHPFGRVKSPVSSAPLLAGASAPSPVMEIVARSCQNCHSGKPEWPAYSYIAPMSWMIEKDVHDAREHMNLSRWSDYDSDRQRQILSEMGSLVRNHVMPPERYLLLHPKARLTSADTELLYRWTQSERRRLRSSEALHAVRTSR
jgi:hypothetical protein